MSAVISASGTWTGITFNTTKAGPTKENVPTLADLNGDFLSNDDWPELAQFVQAVADGYSIGWQHALRLVQTGLTAMLNRSMPPVSAVYTP